MATLVWFRGHDLRVADQAALQTQDAHLVPVAFLEDLHADGRPGGFRHQAVHQALGRLRRDLQARGSDLVVLDSTALESLPALATRLGVTTVRTLDSTDPVRRIQEAALLPRLEALGVALETACGATLIPPGSLRTGSGGPFQVFTPFARAFSRATRVPLPEAAPEVLPPLPPAAVDLPRFESLQSRSGPEPEQLLMQFLKYRIDDYAVARDRLDTAGTSRLSTALALGTLSIREVWHAASASLGLGGDASVQSFLNELLWREFAHHTLDDRPELRHDPFRPAWSDFPWSGTPEAAQAWAEGRTGYPVVDAAARELLATGRVHNRARMIAASFLTKHLLVDWRWGEAHYREHLEDFDPASNSLGWQWSAGCGVDAQPWFRIFNPVSQGRRFDPEGAYVRRWVPELKGLASDCIHSPWEAPVRLDYPSPLVDHAWARARFLAVAKAHLGPRQSPV